MTATHVSAPVKDHRGRPPAGAGGRRPVVRGRAWRTTGFHVSAGLLSALWLLPIVLVLVTSTRTFDDIAAHGVGSWPHSFTFDGFRQAWVDGGQQRPSSTACWSPSPPCCSRSASPPWRRSRSAATTCRCRRVLLLLMLGGNLLPPQILLIPVSKLSELLGIYDQLYALIGVQVGFGVGFYVFVLHGFMRSIPGEIQQAAVIDGASPWQIYWRIILPLARPALAALSALSFTWIFNDLLWAITVLRTDTKMPITASLIGLQGQYVSMWNVIAAGSVIAAAPDRGRLPALPAPLRGRTQPGSRQVTAHERWLLRTEHDHLHRHASAADGRWAELAAWGPHGVGDGSVADGLVAAHPLHHPRRRGARRVHPVRAAAVHRRRPDRRSARAATAAAGGDFTGADADGDRRAAPGLRRRGPRSAYDAAATRRSRAPTSSCAGPS